jgi:ABC-type cobalamin transport system permease subunit
MKSLGFDLAEPALLIAAAVGATAAIAAVVLYRRGASSAGAELVLEVSAALGVLVVALALVLYSQAS